MSKDKNTILPIEALYGSPVLFPESLTVEMIEHMRAEIEQKKISRRRSGGSKRGQTKTKK